MRAAMCLRPQRKCAIVQAVENSETAKTFPIIVISPSSFHIFATSAMRSLTERNPFHLHIGLIDAPRVVGHLEMGPTVLPHFWCVGFALIRIPSSLLSPCHFHKTVVLKRPGNG